MLYWLIFLFRLAAAVLKSRRHLLLEKAALRHQLLVLNRNANRPRLDPVDRVLWVWLSVVWSQWRKTLRLVQPDTVIHWHWQGFRLFWRWNSRARNVGRKSVARETIAPIRQMSHANPLWGAPRIHGELLKLGITLAQRTVSKYIVRPPRRSSGQTWTTFLRNQLGDMVSVDFLTVPTLNFQVLYVFVVLSHLRRKILHLNVTATASGRSTARQLREAFPFTSPPKYLLRDHDCIYGLEFQQCAQALRLEELRIAPRSPWQSPYVERFIGSLRRECLDRPIVRNRSHLHRVLESYLAYYHGFRSHLGLDKDAPEPRRVQPPTEGKIVAFPEVGRLHLTAPSSSTCKQIFQRFLQCQQMSWSLDHHVQARPIIGCMSRVH
jgi:putative transposase